MIFKLRFAVVQNFTKRWTAFLVTAGPLAAAPDFVHEVAPILSKKCIECHTEAKKKGGFSMNTEEAFRHGSRSEERRVGKECA